MRDTAKEVLEVIPYEQYRALIKNGDVFLYRGTGLMSWLIQKITRSPYSHVGIAAWWNTRLMVLEAVGKGVVASPLSENLKRYHGRVDYFWCKTAISDMDRLKMLDFAQMQLGKHYNFAEVLWMGLRVLFGLKLKDKDGDLKHAAGQYFCSEYVARTFRQVGVDLAIDLTGDRVAPDAIARSPALQLKGILKVMEDI